MNITVVGAGFAGLATCWHLLQKKHQVTLIDRVGIGGGASGISPGLLHPYVGKRATPTQDSLAGFEATKALLEVAGRPYSKGILRIPQNEEQRAALSHFPKGEWMGWKGFMIDGLTIDTKAYLQNLWEACAALGATFIQEERTTFTGTTILCTGPAAPGTRSVKGQILKLDIPKPPCSVIGKKYIVGCEDGCLVGATYERNFTSPDADIEKAKALILPNLPPEFQEAKILGCYAGIRATSPGHFPPLIKKLDDDTWVYAGLGSKGLLYHALFAKSLIQLLEA